MSRIAAIYGGAAVHHRALNEPKYRRYFTELIYLPEIADAGLRRFDAVLVPCRLHQGLLSRARPLLEEFLSDGGVVIALGEQPQPFLPGVRWEDRETNFWWWREPGGTSGLAVARPGHGLFRYVTLADATWHYHGVFRPPPGAEELIVDKEGAAVLYVDRVTTAGTMIVSSLDPLYHFGSYFMPAAERFLDGFLEWVAGEPVTAGRVASDESDGLGGAGRARRGLWDRGRGPSRRRPDGGPGAGWWAST